MRKQAGKNQPKCLKMEESLDNGLKTPANNKLHKKFGIELLYGYNNFQKQIENLANWEKTQGEKYSKLKGQTEEKNSRIGQSFYKMHLIKADRIIFQPGVWNVNMSKHPQSAILWNLSVIPCFRVPDLPVPHNGSCPRPRRTVSFGENCKREAEIVRSVWNWTVQQCTWCIQVKLAKLSLAAFMQLGAIFQNSIIPNWWGHLFGYLDQSGYQLSRCVTMCHSLLNKTRTCGPTGLVLVPARGTL